jgi:phospholipid/cholesterol/gamma-HCH transport system substrate-binding protein
VDLPPNPIVLLNVSSRLGEWQASLTSRAAMPPNPAVRRQIAEASGRRDVLPGAILPGIAQLTAVAGRIAGDVASVAERVHLTFTDSAADEVRRSAASPC